MSRVRNSALTDFVYYAGECADSLPEAERKELQKTSLTHLSALLQDPKAALSSDDRSETLATQRGLALALGDKDAAQGFALEQKRVLADAVEAATGSYDEMTYIWHRVEVHDFLGQHEAILPWVESLEQRLPDEYDPPYRKAWLLWKMKRLDEAAASVERALTLSKGARRGRILGLGAEIQKSAGNRDKERELRQAVLSHYQSLPEGQRSKKSIERAEKALAAMDAPPAPVEK
jgi:tetratricopeptide (TPR) repeat protein